MNNMATVEDEQQFNAVCDGAFSDGGGQMGIMGVS